MCDCDRALELISMGLDGALTADGRRELDGHLATCEACRSLSEELAELHGAMPELVEEVPEGFCETVMERVRAEKVVPITPPGGRKRSPWRSWAAMAAVFAVVLVGAGTAVRFFGPGGQESGSAPAAVPETARAELQDVALPQDEPEDGGALAGAGRSADGAAAEDTAEQKTALQKAAVTAAEEPPMPAAAAQTEAPVPPARAAVQPAAPETVPVEPQTAPETAPAESEDPGGAITSFSMPGPGIMLARAPEDGEEGGLTDAMLEHCSAYLKSGALEHGDAVDAGIVSWAPLAAEELEQVQPEEGMAERLDLSDVVVTLGDTAGADHIRLVCDSETGDVLGILPDIENDP